MRLPNFTVVVGLGFTAFTVAAPQPDITLKIVISENPKVHPACIVVGAECSGENNDECCDGPGTCAQLGHGNIYECIPSEPDNDRDFKHGGKKSKVVDTKSHFGHKDMEKPKCYEETWYCGGPGEECCPGLDCKYFSDIDAQICWNPKTAVETKQVARPKCYEETWICNDDDEKCCPELVCHYYPNDDVQMCIKPEDVPKLSDLGLKAQGKELKY